MFASLSERFSGVIRRLRGHGVLTEKHLEAANAEIRNALLEADVHHSAVDTFLERVQIEALGQEIIKSLKPTDLYLKIVHDALIDTLGGTGTEFDWGGRVPAIVMLVGLQGSGKTTTAAKLGHWFRQQGKRVLLVPVDLARPAAVAQLQALGREWDLPVFDSASATSPVAVAEAALAQARQSLADVVIIDTAGRLHIDTALMQELSDLKKTAQPSHTLLVVDAMAGQQGLIAAQGFHQTTPLSGVILTKADGDARGGVALSCRAALHTPILFVGIGEKVDALEAFHPDRLASRILGMGDLATLSEKVEAVMSRETAAERVQKLAQGAFTLEDYRSQLQDVTKMGSMEGLLKMIPGAGQMLGKVNFEQIQQDLARKEAMINSMTFQERGNTRLLNGSRRKRIASGSGTTVTDVNRLIKEFEIMQKMMKKGARRKGVPPQLLQMLGRPGF